ncbi:hypothetical protein SPLAT_v1c01730 [Spiroplasma platyhelix PALS-1]|nr:hypothetical protein SPLAT_v1c01730 [Spiroplasma platyhelix PALS-1]
MLLNNFTIKKQVDALVNQHTIQENDLTFFEIGSNDLIQGLDLLLDYKEVVTNAIANQKQALETLIEHGSKHILLMNTPDLGNVPNFKNTGQKQQASELSKQYNNLWLDMVSNLQAKYPHYFKVFDLYQTFPKLLANFASNGGNIDEGAVSYELNPDIIIEGKITPKWEGSASPSTIDQYFFFDFVHPTASIHATVGEMLYQTVNSAW